MGDIESSKPTKEEIESAIKCTEYKYFGDYEMHESERDAVDILVNVAKQKLNEINGDT